MLRRTGQPPPPDATLATQKDLLLARVPPGGIVPPDIAALPDSPRIPVPRPAPSAPVAPAASQVTPGAPKAAVPEAASAPVGPEKPTVSQLIRIDGENGTASKEKPKTALSEIILNRRVRYAAEVVALELQLERARAKLAVLDEIAAEEA